MSFAPVSPHSGSPVSGFTSPTYTFTTDVAPSINGKQFAVTAIGGTQTGVELHTVSKPFTISFFRPMVLRTLPQANPVTGVIKDIPVNSYKFITRKGVEPGANQSTLVARITTTIDIPAGADSYDAPDIKAMISAHFGVGHVQATGIADTVLSGIL